MKTFFLSILFFLAVSASHAQIDGSLDPSFDAGVSANAAIGNVLPLADGRMMIWYGFNKYNNISRSEIARLNADGSLDLSFDPGQGALFGNVRALVVQPDGKMIIGGNYTNYNNNYSERLTRILPNGSWDSTFNTTSGIGGEVNAIMLQPDGKVLVAGSFTAYKGKTSRNLVRIHPDGSFDSTFKVGTGPNNGTSFSGVSAIQLQADGKIIIGGAFSDYNGKAMKRVARINSDGTLDTTFNPGTGPSSDLANVLLLPDGKVMISGYFGSVSSVPASRIARLNSNGSMDTSFKAVLSPNPYAVGSMCLLPDGKLIVCADNSFSRLNTNGTRDSSFVSGTTPSTGGVSTCRLLPDGRPMITGTFTAYGGVARKYIARLKGPAGAAVNGVTGDKNPVVVYPNPSHNNVHFDFPENIHECTLDVYDLHGKKISSMTVDGTPLNVRVSDWTKGVYCYTLSGNANYSGKFIVE